MDGVSKVLVHSNNEAAGDEEAGRSFIELDDDGGGDDGGGDDGIPHICHFWYATIFFRLVKGTPKKCVNSRRKLPRNKTA